MFEVSPVLQTAALYTREASTLSVCFFASSSGRPSHTSDISCARCKCLYGYIRTYSTSLPSSKQQRRISYLNSAEGCREWSIIRFSRNCWYVSIPAFLRSYQRKVWTHSSIPTTGLPQAQSPTTRTLATLFLPVIWRTFSCFLLRGVSDFLPLPAPAPLESR